MPSISRRAQKEPFAHASTIRQSFQDRIPKKKSHRRLNFWEAVRRLQLTLPNLYHSFTHRRWSEPFSWQCLPLLGTETSDRVKPIKSLSAFREKLSAPTHSGGIGGPKWSASVATEKRNNCIIHWPAARALNLTHVWHKFTQICYMCMGWKYFFQENLIQCYSILFVIQLLNWIFLFF